MSQNLVFQSPTMTNAEIYNMQSTCDYTGLKLAIKDRRPVTARPKNLAQRNQTGGDERDRTANLCLARAALSQLSYIPLQTGRIKENGGPKWTRTTDLSLIRGML